ncbi:MAG TPA: Gfo/Idh/MocA family oxidoreductase [Pirellulales bacterium]|nr:Gfo/Idh/MocA family oxidoreductase [Pirellulales bacterium]
MNLTPEERAIGKENFQAAIGSEYTRRDFLKGTLAATVAGAGLGAMYFGYAEGGPPKNPLRVGYIGVGDEGEVLLGALHSENTRKYIQVVAISDIRPFSVHRAFHGDHSSPDALGRRPGLMSMYGWKTEDEARKHIKVYDKDYMDLLNDPNVEAVVIALPLHLHSVASIKAMRKGKHVITEKLMGHSVHECKEMGRVAKETNKILAVGHQRNYSVLYDNAKWLIRHGLLGDLHYIRAQWHRGNLPGHDSWQMPMPGDEKLVRQVLHLEKIIASKSAKPADIDEAEKLLAQVKAQQADAKVNAAAYGYESLTLPDGKQRSALEELIRWRLWNRTGAGLMAELGSHQLDAAGILIGAALERAHGTEHEHGLPLNVTGLGGRYIFPMDRDCEDHVYCMYEFPGPEYHKDPNKKIALTYSSINGNGFGDYGEVVMGTEGTLVLEKEQEAMLFKSASTGTHIKVSEDKGGPVLDTAESGGHAVAVGAAALDASPISRGYTEELEHWAWCIQNPAPDHKPRVGPAVALADAVIALVSSMAIRDPKEKARIEFNKAWFDLSSDETPEGIKPDLNRDEYKPSSSSKSNPSSV